MTMEDRKKERRGKKRLQGRRVHTVKRSNSKTVERERKTNPTGNDLLHCAKARPEPSISTASQFFWKSIQSIGLLLYLCVTTIRGKNISAMMGLHLSNAFSSLPSGPEQQQHF